MSTYSEQGAVFDCNGNRLLGIAAVPEAQSEVGVLILVGGPQYRVGSHRQFTLLARQLAEAGIPSFRFDYGGMGDSEGERQAFHEVRDDVTAALDCFQSLAPGVTRVVLWGLCDAATASLMFAWREPRVSAMILLNPWVHMGEYSPEVKLSHYYAPLLRGPDTWRRFFTGKINVVPALKEFVGDSALILRKWLGRSFGVPQKHGFEEAMLEGLQRFKGNALVIVGGQDLTGREFLGLATNDKEWKRAMASASVTVHEVPQADHTFSKGPWRDEVTRLTLDWVLRERAGS